ncbi:phage tail sheath C-terminal domain-containing protein [Knoellia sp. S7-12]|uniref:phage tail sheath family protein n=1 Tax=Knoellia sp. S7-12 TaxID=3126698 RepID=UPI0033661F30
MPEYRTPGTYVEETTLRSRSIEGVPTSTLGMVGVTEFGPVPHPSTDGNWVHGPVLVASTAEYERVYGGFSNRAMPCRLALAARAFFTNGGQRLYVQRVFVPTPVSAGTGPEDDIARIDLPVGANDPVARWEARWPGAAGSRVRVVTRFRRSENIQVGTQLRGLQPGAAVETAALVAGQPPVLADVAAPANLQVVTQVEGMLRLRDGVGGLTAPVPGQAAFHVTLDVEVHFGDRVDLYEGLELGAEHPRFITTVLHATEPADQSCLVKLVGAKPAVAGPAPSVPTAATLLAALVSLGEEGVHLAGGSDGGELTPSALQGQGADSDSSSPATGLAALGEVDDIAIVAMPDSTYFRDEESTAEAVDALITHCERARFRFALIDPPENAAFSEVRAFRSRFDSSYGALYHPWLRVSDLTPGADPELAPTPVDVPPSGAMAGIFARSDTERGVHKAPANQVVRGITEFVAPVSAREQEMLNPEGVNALRYFKGRGNLVWGARTISSDPEWKYVNVRRLLIYLEHSIEKSTQWAVFEPNDERLWVTIRSLIEAFLISIWRSGALMGTKPEEAFFVRCDRTTMTQNDLDNGRLLCEIGVAPVRPAEFIIFRIAQFTSDAPGG